MLKLPVAMYPSFFVFAHKQEAIPRLLAGATQVGHVAWGKKAGQYKKIISG